MVYLVADSAEVTVLRSVASTAYGTYTLNVPEGIGLENIHQFDAPGNQLGYVSTLTKRRVGRFFRRFIRADVTVTAANPADPDWVADSDIDYVLREAEERVSGDFFLESDITLAGLGSWRPFVDFNIGDIVNVEIWGMVVQLPVTRIEPIVSDHEIIDWLVHVGGQLISDDDARVAENQVIYRALVQDRRELAGLAAKATKAVKDSSEAKSTADSAKTVADEAKQATEDNRSYIDEQLVLAGAAVDQGREYLRQMEEHVAAGNAAAGRAEDLAGQAAAAANEAVQILDQLDPLRDDVAAAHAEVVRLHDEASQFTAQAAEHVRQASAHAADAVASASSASQHAADGKRYAEQALAHRDEGERQAGLAADSASAALQNANRAQQIVDDANGLLSQVEGYSQDAKDALAGAEALLGNVDGSGKSLGQVLLEVAQKHQETLTAHQDILDLHGEVLQKHGEAINYVAMAAAQASSAAMHASMAAQEALDIAYYAAKAAESASLAADDAAKAASSAGKAADEAAAAAENNRQAIGKLQEADGKLQEADDKLQRQINILEDSQELLVRAVQILAGAVAQASMAAQSALDAADDAGKAAGEALTASQHNSSAVDAMQDAVTARDDAYQIFKDTKDAVDTRQDAALEQLKAQAADLVKLQNESTNIIMATSAGTSFPGVNVQPSGDSNFDWEFLIPDTKGALSKVEFWNPAANNTYELNAVRVLGVSTSGHMIRANNGSFVQVTWAKAKAVQRAISQRHTTEIKLTGEVWTTISGLTVSANNAASRGYLKARVVWTSPSRGARYITRIVVDGQEVARDELPNSIKSGEPITQSAEAANISLAAGKNVRVQVWANASYVPHRRITSAQLDGTWIETL